MSKICEMHEIIEELKNAAAAIEAAANCLTKMFSREQAPEAETVTESSINLEDIRAILAEKSRAGYTAQIRSLLLKYGANKLSAVDPASYGDLLKDVEVLGNAP